MDKEIYPVRNYVALCQKSGERHSALHFLRSDGTIFVRCDICGHHEQKEKREEK